MTKIFYLDHGDAQTDGQSVGPTDPLSKIPTICRLSVPNLKLIGSRGIIYMYYIHDVYSTCMLKYALNSHYEFQIFIKNPKINQAWPSIYILWGYRQATSPPSLKRIWSLVLEKIKKICYLDHGDAQTDGQSVGPTDPLSKIPTICRLSVPNLKLIGSRGIIYMYYIHDVYSTCMLKYALNSHYEFQIFIKNPKINQAWPSIYILWGYRQATSPPSLKRIWSLVLEKIKKICYLDHGDAQTDGQSDGQTDQLRKIPMVFRLIVPNLKLIGCTGII